MMEWGWLAGTVRIVERVVDALTDHDRVSLEPSVEWSFNTRRRDYDFTVEVTNRLNHRICIECVKILKPSNGALRLDSNPPIIDLDEPASSRDRWLGSAATVMELNNDVDPGQKSWVQFVFVPPPKWQGGDFRCNMYMSIKRAKETHTFVPIHRSLVHK